LRCLEPCSWPGIALKLESCRADGTFELRVSLDKGMPESLDLDLTTSQEVRVTKDGESTLETKTLPWNIRLRSQ
jgi:hypothetical protein